MTMRVCCLGNSHLAALREGWGARPGRWPGLEMQFVGGHRDLLLRTEVRDGQLVPTSEATLESFRKLGGVDQVDLRAFDAFVVAGCGVAINVAGRLHGEARWPGLPSVDAADPPDPEGPLLMSHPAVLAAMTEGLRERLGPRVVARLREGTDRPILLTAQPRVSVDVVGKRHPAFQNLMRALHKGDGGGVSDLFDQGAAQAVMAEGGTYLPQPRRSIVRDVCTAKAFMRGARRLTAKPGVPQPPDDMLHANATYGVVVLDQIAAAFGLAAPVATAEAGQDAAQAG